jgi:hypothetical protein
VAASQIPPPTAQLWERLVTGKFTHKFNLFAANMALSRATRVVAGDPGQKPAMIAELHQFFTKFAGFTAGELNTLT